MPEFLARLLIVIAVIWLVQLIVDTLLVLKPPAPRIILAVTIFFGLVYLLFGNTFLPLK